MNKKAPGLLAILAFKTPFEALINHDNAPHIRIFGFFATVGYYSPVGIKKMVTIVKLRVKAHFFLL